jgi:hypothetical protein
LADNASVLDILTKIEELLDRPVSNDILTKQSLKESAEDNLKNLGITEQDIKKIGAATSAREIEIVRSELTNKRFGQLQSQLNTAHYWNIALGTLLIGIFLILG